MALAQFTDGKPHNPTCSGCPECSEQMAALLGMGPAERSQWLQQQTADLVQHYAALRHNSSHNTGSLRFAAKVPAPPSLAAALRENAARYQATTPPALARSLTETVREKLLAAMTASRRPITNVNRTAPRAASRSGVPAPPSLIDAIQKQRNMK